MRYYRTQQGRVKHCAAHAFMGDGNYKTVPVFRQAVGKVRRQHCVALQCVWEGVSCYPENVMLSAKRAMCL